MQSAELGRDTRRNYWADRLKEMALLEETHFKPHPGYFFICFNMQHTEIFLVHLLANTRIYMRKSENNTASVFSNTSFVLVYPTFIPTFVYQNLGFNLYNTLFIPKMSPPVCTVIRLRVGKPRICASNPGRGTDFFSPPK